MKKRILGTLLFLTTFLFFLVTMSALFALHRDGQKRIDNLQHLRVEPDLFDVIGDSRPSHDAISESDRNKIRTLIQRTRDTVGIPEVAWDYITESYPKWMFNTRRGQRLSNIYKNLSVLNGTGLSGDLFQSSVTQYALYDPADPNIDAVIRDVANMEITKMQEKTGGTQIKLLMYIEGHGTTIFKPGRFDRDYEASPNYFYFGDHERHNAEIATFHLDRILGFYRAPPVVGRRLNVSDIWRLADQDPFKKTHFTSPAGNKCFHGTCRYFCTTTDAICGNPDMIEGAMIVTFASGHVAKTSASKSPWRRSYNKHRKALWETNATYCHDHVLNIEKYRHGRLLNDLIDTHILDFLTGNLDRHHYEHYLGFPQNDTFLLHFDHGRGFGRSQHDEMSILAPLYQCCRIRYSTFVKILTFYVGPTRLSDAMRRATSRDPLAPILNEKHFDALDRRVEKVMSTLAECIYEGRRVTNVIIDDGF